MQVSILIKNGMFMLFGAMLSFMATLLVLTEKGLLLKAMPWLKTIGVSDLFAHFALTGALGFVLGFISKRYFEIGRFKVSRLVLIFVAFAVLDETSQLFRANRSFSFYDMGANVLGLIVFSQLAQFIRKYLDKGKLHDLASAHN
jgi:VanZ family protein